MRPPACLAVAWAVWAVWTIRTFTALETIRPGISSRAFFLSRLVAGFLKGGAGFPPSSSPKLDKNRLIVRGRWRCDDRPCALGRRETLLRASAGRTQERELARPMVRRGASLDANQAWWQLLEERQDRAALQPSADDHLAGGINSVDLEDRLRDVETDRRDRLHDWLLRIVGALTAPRSMALTCRWRSRPQHQ